MKIFTLCIDPERGRYLAISTQDPALRGYSSTSEDEALGVLIRKYPTIRIEEVVSIFEVAKS